MGLSASEGREPFHKRWDKETQRVVFFSWLPKNVWWKIMGLFVILHAIICIAVAFDVFATPLHYHRCSMHIPFV